MRRAVIVFNPASRNAPSQARLVVAAQSLRNYGWQVDLQVTEAAGHATQLARESAQSGADVVFSCGGDGTINEVVNGLVGTEAALGVLRGGMGDVFGREVHVPREPEAALRVLVDGDRRRFDLGLANERYFLLMAGVGFDARVVHDVPSRAKRILGSSSYGVWGARLLASYRSRGVLLRVDGVEREGRLYWMMLGNTRSYGGILRLADHALVDDGLLDAYLFEARSAAQLLITAGRIAAHRLEHARGVSFQRVRDLEVLSLGLPFQVDGEYIGETPVKFGVAPAAIDVLLPRGHGAELFGSAAAGA